MAGGKHSFSATLRREGPLYLVDVPLRVSRALGGGTRIPVVIHAPGARPIQGTLNPRGGGAHKVFLNAEVRRDAGVALGERISLELELDGDAREVDTPPDLAAALREADVLALFEGYTPAKRRHIIDWLDAVASEDARERRVAKVSERLLADQEKRADRARRAKA